MIRWIAALWWTLMCVPSAYAFDHEHVAFKEVLSGAVTPAGVDYARMAARREALFAYASTLSDVDPSTWSKGQQLALYVNAYNAWTLLTMLDAGVPKSIRSLDDGKVWDARRFRVAGEDLTLNDLEHRKARPLSDGRVHAVVNCAAKGCPPLPDKPLTASHLETLLDEATRTWMATNAFVVDGDTVALSMIFQWYADDFRNEGVTGDLGVAAPFEQALRFVARFVDEATRKQLLSGALSATWMPYDWSVNAR